MRKITSKKVSSNLKEYKKIVDFIVEKGIKDDYTFNEVEQLVNDIKKSSNYEYLYKGFQDSSNNIIAKVIKQKREKGQEKENGMAVEE